MDEFKEKPMGGEKLEEDTKPLEGKEPEGSFADYWVCETGCNWHPSIKPYSSSCRESFGTQTALTGHSMASLPWDQLLQEQPYR
jgi:hypothetical protein